MGVRIARKNVLRGTFCHTRLSLAKFFFLTFLYGWLPLQTRPVPFKVRAVVTSSDIEFNMQDIDFGFCTVYESVRRTVTITNKSVLPQPFGFCGVPDVSEITFQE